ncbi:MAG TPA: cation:proton antiporter, partial [Gemmatimonadaceae bacterium]|nr:cation:proton antiporter [Gemmatimonadaceae bacterium]
MPVENTLIILFSVATGAAITARWLKVPYTVALVVTGMALGATDAIASPHLTRELLFAVILPGLLFEAAFHIEVDAFVRNKMAITSLAIPAVIIAIVIGGAGTALALEKSSSDPTFTLGQGLVFGALVAATDPIAVVALFKELNIPARLSTLIEGESLLNDGTA